MIIELIIGMLFKGLFRIIMISLSGEVFLLFLYSWKGREYGLGYVRLTWNKGVRRVSGKSDTFNEFRGWSPVLLSALPLFFFLLPRAHGHERTWNSKVGHVGKVTLEHLTNNNETGRGGFDFEGNFDEFSCSRNFDRIWKGGKRKRIIRLRIILFENQFLKSIFFFRTIWQRVEEWLFIIKLRKKFSSVPRRVAAAFSEQNLKRGWEYFRNVIFDVKSLHSKCIELSRLSWYSFLFFFRNLKTFELFFPPPSRTKKNGGERDTHFFQRNIFL